MFLSCTLVHRVIKLTYIQFRCKTSEVVARYRMNSPLLDHKKNTSRFTGARRAMFGRSARACATNSGSETLHVPPTGSKQPRTALVLCRGAYLRPSFKKFRRSRFYLSNNKVYRGTVGNHHRISPTVSHGKSSILMGRDVTTNTLETTLSSNNLLASLGASLSHISSSGHIVLGSPI